MNEKKKPGGVPGRRGKYATRELKDMRYVYDTLDADLETRRKDTGSQKLLRQIADESPEKFLAMKRKAEEELRASRPKRDPAVAAVRDAVEVKVEELVASLIRSFKKGA